MSERLTAARMRHLFELLSRELAARETVGEVYVVGGAVMCLALSARDATRDVDALFMPAGAVHQAAERVAVAAGVEPGWLNDAAKGFLGDRPNFETHLELSNLRVYTAHPRYLLAMKCMAFRLGPESHDLDDVRYLLRHLGITTPEAALRVVEEYFDGKNIPVRTRLALEELLPPTPPLQR